LTRTPVALVIFNRPDVTQRVVQEIARARPSRLLVVADGPRADRASDADACAATREVIERVDWDCEVLRNYSDVNLGCGRRMVTGLQWVFEQAEEAIVLEDDCLPHPSFFRYCDELLETYRHDERVMHISGDNWNFGEAETPYSYFFSCYCYSCGWASWRRAFRHYDPEMRMWPLVRDTPWLLDLLGDAEAVAFWKPKFELAYTAGVEKIDGWDWQWLFACWAQRGLSILPRTNLISNIGFGATATHTKQAEDARANVPTAAMSFPLRHPPLMARDLEADRAIVEQVGLAAAHPGLYQALRRRCAAALPAPVRRSILSLRSMFLSTRAARQ